MKQLWYNFQVPPTYKNKQDKHTMREYCINELGNWNSALKDNFWQRGDYKVCLGLGVRWTGMFGEAFFYNFLFSNI